MKWSLCLLFSLTVIVLIVFKRADGFFGATSPGTMVQLSTSHVPTEEDMYYWKNVYPKIVRKEIHNMTEADL
jgi:hypothetical protein